MKKKTTNSIEDQTSHIDEANKILQQSERELLLFKTEGLLVERPFDVKLEQFELTNGFKGSLQEITAMMRKSPRNLDPMFPYRIPFFKLIFKLNGWHDKNYRNFIKPPVVGRIIRRFIYKRFPENVLPSLLELPNESLYKYVKRYKLYQYLTDDGLIMLEGFIWDAIKVMQDSNDWTEFENRYTQLYNLDVPAQQTKLFEDE